MRGPHELCEAEQSSTSLRTRDQTDRIGATESQTEIDPASP